MASSYNTLNGLIQLNDKNLADLEVTDLLQDAPVLAQMYAQPASNGTQHKYLKITTAASAAFRAALAGLTKTHSADTLVTDTLAILDASFSTDVALAKGYKDGVDAWLQLETMRSLKQAFAVAEKQVFYGTGNDASGFAGLADNSQLDATTDTMVVSAGGSTASVQTSCFMLRSDKDNVSFILGNDGNIVVDEEPTVIEKVVNPGSDNTVYPAYYVAICGYAGFQIGSAYSAARICNIETDDLSSSTAFTDTHLMRALAKFPGGRGPNMIAMNRNAQLLLWNSRSAYSPTGAPAATPVEFMGIPIVVTDQILSTESVVS